MLLYINSLRRVVMIVQIEIFASLDENAFVMRHVPIYHLVLTYLTSFFWCSTFENQVLLDQQWSRTTLIELRHVVLASDRLRRSLGRYALNHVAPLLTRLQTIANPTTSRSFSTIIELDSRLA
jgi:hypothetical protein